MTIEKINAPPRVSVIIPTFNRSAYLRQAIDSILSQTFLDFEIIIVDNFSTDETFEVISSYSDVRIHYFKNNSNIGPIRNHNAALRQVRGEYIHLFSDDDVMSSIYNIELKVNILDKYPKVGLVHSDIKMIDSNGEFNGGNWASENPNWGIVVGKSLMSGKVAHKLLYYGNNFVNMPTVLLRNNLLVEYNIEFNNQLGYLIDWNLWLQLSLFCDFYFINQVLVSYRIHGGNESLIMNKELMFHELVIAKIGLITLFGKKSDQVISDLQQIIKSTKMQLKVYGHENNIFEVARCFKRKLTSLLK